MGHSPRGHEESDTAEGTHGAGTLHCGPRGSFVMGGDSFVKCALPAAFPLFFLCCGCGHSQVGRGAWGENMALLPFLCGV